MQKYMRCTNCGYDLYGPEYISHVVDTDSYSNALFSSNNALLETCTKPVQSIPCPFCKEPGHWTTF